MEIKEKVRSSSVRTKKETKIKERGSPFVRGAKTSVKTIRRGVSGVSVTAQKGKLIARKTAGQSENSSVQQNPDTFAVEQVERAANKIKDKAKEKAGAMTKWSAKTVKNTVKRKTGKTATSNISFQSADSAVKTSSVPFRTPGNRYSSAKKYSVSSVRKSKRAVSRAQATAQKSKKAAKGAVNSAKTLAAALKRIALAIKSFFAFLLAGGWLVLVIILFVGLIAALIGSVFGIFFGNGSAYNGENLSYAMSEVNAEYNKRIKELAGGQDYEQMVIKINGSVGTDMNIIWKQVLAVYSVRVSTGEQASMPIDFSDPSKMETLKNTFFDMVSFSGSVSSSTEDVSDSEGNISEVERKTLTVEVTSKNASDMVSFYSFNSEQKELLEQLLAPDMDSAWNALLYGGYSGGIVSANGDIVETAISQLGNVGGQPYWSWYGFSSRVEWCACFVSWCAEQNGFIQDGIIPKFAYCDSGIAWFKEHNLWKDGGYEPVSGNIIFFDWNGDGISDHVGIVEYTMNGVVHTIEGNSGDTCTRMSYMVGSSVIIGYGTPFYELSTLK